MANDYTDSFAGDPYFIKKGEQLSAVGMNAALNTKEKVANKQMDSADATGTLTSNSSDSYYPTSKLVGKNLDTLNTTISTGLNGKQNTITAGTADDILTKTTATGTLGTLTKTISVAAAASASNDKIPTEKAVATALDSKLSAGDLTTLQTDVSALQTAVGGLQKLLPAGTILMYDGTSWVDNSTLPGWYACTAANKNLGLTPNLENHFVVGAGSQVSKGQDTGSNTLTAAMLPKHTHSIYTDATKNTARTTSKTLTGSFPGLYRIVAANSYNGIVAETTEASGDADGWADHQPMHKINIDATHEHTGATNDTTGYQTDNNTSNMPLCYAIIYIRKCA
ncbi:MAG: hypothetical protein LBK68_05250 [Candidatus Margulisbacteria bacterium]|jgi:microcystin-dependent protein|nr:hypothetical protein [Candidatus Margulisiibacteriota bacterium]